MISADDVLSSHLATVRFQPGYDQDEVDDFLDRAAQTLREAGTRPSLRRDITVDDVDGARFRQTTWRAGYAIDDVDALMAQLRESVGRRPWPAVVGAPVLPAPTRSGWAWVRWVLAYLTIGAPPPEPRRRVTHPRRAARASSRKIVIDAAGVTWTARSREGRLAASEIAEVMLVRLLFSTISGPSIPVPYALVLDSAGVVLLRVSGATKDAFTQPIWEPLGVPVARVRLPEDRPKDARRRWPEAFSFAMAYPIALVFGLMAAWIVVALILDALGV